MSYFGDRYPAVSLPLAEPALEQPGLRNAQAGAIHAVAAHFTLQAPLAHDDGERDRGSSPTSEPAVVVMPTGSGKTAVLLVSAFLLRAERVLVVTPSRAVRNQFAGVAASLDRLKAIGVLPDDLPPPRVHEVSHRLASAADWRRLRRFDLVVGTPNSLSPGAAGVSAPPDPDLFDLVLMDEGHHSPAPTWRALLDAFPRARTILTTATPFRLDEREIRGRVVYDYPLGRALDDRVICHLEYVPVEPRGISPDIALARQAEATLREQKASQPACRLLVRTDSKVHAKELETIYRTKTKLDLRSIHSGHSQRWIDGSIRKLKEGELDGLICVDMLGEGFDFPPLKVAAIHRKHKTLPVTLQFVGRFGRVTENPPPEEKAYVLAVPEELEGEIQNLYRTGGSWQRLLPILHEARSEIDRQVREDLATFEPEPSPAGDGLGDLSLWALKPLAHVKVYELRRGTEVDLRGELRLSGTRIVRRDVSDRLRAAVVITERTSPPRWAKGESDAFDLKEHDLIVLHHARRQNLLFINSSRRGSVALYEEIAKQLTAGPDGRPRHRLLPLYKINRVLRGADGARCFNLGMRNRQASQVHEAYRILAGPEVERAVKRSDGKLYHRGHLMVGLFDGAEERTVTLGFSSSSKVWRNVYMRVPELVRWCRELAVEIASNRPVHLDANLDASLGTGEALTALPDNLLAATWDDEVYRRALSLVYRDRDGADHEVGLVDGTWSIDGSATPNAVALRLDAGGCTWPVLLSLGQDRLFTSPLDDDRLPRVCAARGEAGLIDYLNETPLNLYTADFSRLQGLEIFRAREPGDRPEGSAIFDQRCFRTDWLNGGMQIDREIGWLKGREYQADGFDVTTVQGRLATWLPTTAGFPIVFYDHGSGEIADFITIEERSAGEAQRWWDEREPEREDGVHVWIFHVKGAGGKRPGNRVGDAYEVCGQVVKSLMWVPHRKELARHLQRRCQQRSFFLRGDLESAQRLLSEVARPVHFHLGLVQPGITRGKAEPKILELLAATDDYVRNAVDHPAFVFCSP